MELASAARTRSGRIRSVALRAPVGLLVGGALIVAFLRMVNIGEVSHRLTHLRIGFAALSAIAFLAAYAVRALRWRWLLKPFEISIGRAVAIYQVATFLNWMLPLRGGEVAKTILLRRSDGVPVSRSLATVSMDKAMDLLPAIVLIALIPFVRIHLSRLLWVLLLTALVVEVLIVLVLCLAAWRRERALALLTLPLTVLLPNRLRERIQPFITTFIATLIGLIRRPRLLLIAGGYTVVAVTCDALFCLLAFKSVGVDVALPVVLYGYTFFNLAFILPTPPGQVGSTEIIGLLVFSSMLGMNRSAVAAMFLFSHPWTSILMTCSGLFCLSVMGVRLRSALRLSREQPGTGVP